RPTVVASYGRSTGENYFRHLCGRLNFHFSRNPVTESSCLAIARAFAIECAGTIDDTWRTDRLDYSRGRRNRVAGAFFYFTDRTNRVVRLGLFLDGDPAAGARQLAQAPAEKR